MSNNNSTLPKRLIVIPADDPLLRTRRRDDLIWAIGDTNATTKIQKYTQPLLISAFGIPPGEKIRVEILEVSPTIAHLDLCSMFVYDIIEGTIASDGWLQTPGKVTDDFGNLITTDWVLTAENPQVILSGLPINQYYQLVYTGATPFEFDVNWSVPTPLDYQIQSYGDQLRDFEDRPDLWIPTGTTRCLLPDDPDTALDTGNGTQPREERLLVGPGGAVHWELIRLLHWEDTGWTRDPFVQDDTAEKKQTTYCGQTKWIVGDDQVWQDTGFTRLLPDGVTIEKQQKNQFDRLRWVQLDVIVAPIPLTPTKWVVVPSGSQTAPSGIITVVPAHNHPFYVDVVGYAFTAANKPAGATVAVGLPRGTGNCYIYPNPQLDATVPVWSTAATPALLGYARQDPYGLVLTGATTAASASV
jgi:hypothetical protein